MMKILGIHGRATIIGSSETNWGKRVDDIRSRGHNIYVPQFDPCDDPTYELWEEELVQINIESYDALIVLSHGCGVLARYIKENDIHLKRVIFCCPGKGISKRKNTAKLYKYFEKNDMKLKKHIDEIFIVHGMDDEVVPYSEGTKFQKQIGGKLYALEGFGHKLGEEALTFINDLAISGEQ